jgi:hypothetical protein
LKAFDFPLKGLFNLPIPMHITFRIGVAQINLGEAKNQQ